MKNRFFSIKCSDGSVKNFIKFATGEISMQTIRGGRISRPKLLNRKK